MKITATIITLDEERNIQRAIESLRCADEILIVDSGSVDRTVELAEKLGVRVIEAGWRGYAGQKNWAAGQASHDWILSLDADEALSEALEAEIWNLKKNGPQADAYTLPRLAQYLGRWILHSGWYPDRKVRLYNRHKAKWAQELAARKTPIGWARLIFDPLWTFAGTYFLRLGFLDGLEGLIIAYMAAFYTFLKYAKARNMS